VDLDATDQSSPADHGFVTVGAPLHLRRNGLHNGSNAVAGIPPDGVIAIFCQAAAKKGSGRIVSVRTF
jgi:hypothetical protein